MKRCICRRAVRPYARLSCDREMNFEQTVQKWKRYAFADMCSIEK